MATKPTHTLNHPGGGYFRIKPKVIPYGDWKSISEILEMLDIVHIDADLMQRLFDAWEPDRVDSWFTSLLDSSGLATPIIFGQVSKILKYLRTLDKETPNNESLQRSIEEFKKIEDKGLEYVLLDGQHRCNYLDNWIQPKTEVDRYIPTSKELDAFFGKAKGESFTNVQVSEVPFCDLPEHVKDDILSTKLLTVIYESGDLKLIQKVFKVVNASTPPRGMEVNMISLSPVVEFLRNMMNPTSTSGDVNVRQFFELALKKEKSPDKLLKHKGAELMCARLLGYLNRTDCVDWNKDEGVRKSCDYDSDVKLATTNTLQEVFSDIAEAWLTFHNVITSGKATTMRIIPNQNSNWSNTNNIFLFVHSLKNGSYQYLKNSKKIAVIQNKRRFVEAVQEMLQTITAETEYMYVDRFGKHTDNIREAEYAKNPTTGVEEPVFATQFHTCDGKTTEEKVPNKHSFSGHNQGTDTRKFRLRNEAMEKYFNKFADDWVNQGIIKLLDKSRGVSGKTTLVNAVVKQSYIDANTGEKITPQALAMKENLADSHFGRNYVDGGGETLVGNAKFNQKQGKKEYVPKVG